jgi:hypothetical protein
MESYSGIDARKGARFRFRRKPLTPETSSSLHRNLRAGREAPIPNQCAEHLLAGDGFPLVWSEGHPLLVPSLPLRLRQLPLLSSAGAFVQDFHQTIDKPATKFLARLGRDWADKEKRLLEPLAKPAALFAPGVHPARNEPAPPAGSEARKPLFVSTTYPAQSRNQPLNPIFPPFVEIKMRISLPSNRMTQTSLPRERCKKQIQFPGRTTGRLGFADWVLWARDLS